MAIDLKSLKIKDGNTVTGYVALFDSPSRIMRRPDGQPFVEIIRAGAFTNTLSDGHAVQALYSHVRTALLGSTSAGTLKIAQDDKGLFVEISLPETSDANDLKALLSRGEQFGGSFSASVIQDRWSQSTIDLMQCELIELALNEVTVTAFPAYPETSVVLREHQKSSDQPAINIHEAQLFKEKIRFNLL